MVTKIKYKNLAWNKYCLILLASLTFGCVEKDSLSADQIASNAYAAFPETAVTNLTDSILEFKFNWLSNANNKSELNDSPASSPICGWVVLNNLDQSIIIYNQAGKSLGYIDQYRQGRPSPGQSEPTIPTGIPNTHLKQLAEWIMTSELFSMDDFFNDFNIVLDNINPDQNTSQDQTALLMSQPLALVRAQVQIKLKEDGRKHQNWEQLREQLRQNIHIGLSDHEPLDMEQPQASLSPAKDPKLKDGLLAFWLENKNRQIDLRRKYYKSTEDQSALPFAPAASDDINQVGFTISLLMDPSGAIRLTTGILPVATLQIPQEQYSEAINSIEVSFLSSPILTDRESVSSTLPQASDYTWSWQETEPSSWQQLSTVGYLKFIELEKVFGDQSPSIWQALLENGYLELNKTKDEAIITLSKRKRKLTEIEELVDLAPKLERFLNGHRVMPFQTSSILFNPQDTREGWLKVQLGKQNE